MNPGNSDENTLKVAVRCDKCRRVVAYKLSTTSGHLQLKCPKCGNEMKIDLSLRRTKVPIFYRTAKNPATIFIR